MNKNGFTLIELLVVVLIIGILAAIALPQYQTAVDKARFMQAVADLDAIKKAEEIYFLANGKYTRDPGELDLDLGYTVENEASSTYISKDQRCVTVLKEVDKVGGSNLSTKAANMSVWCYLKKSNPNSDRIAAFVYMDHATDENDNPIPQNQRRLCLALDDSPRATRVCKSFGKEKIPAITGVAGWPMQ